MAGTLSRFAFKLVAAAVAIPVGTAVTKGTQKAWLTARPNAPLHDPTDVETRWHDAIAWAALTGLGTGVASLITTKGADTLWRAATGSPSPRPKPPKQKKQKAREDAATVEV